MKGKQKTMDSVQMYEALEERAAVIGRFEVYSSLHKVICKHVEKLQSRMKTLMAVTPEDVTPKEYIRTIECRSQNDAQQDACFELLDILSFKINESATDLEKWHKVHSESDENPSKSHNNG